MFPNAIQALCQVAPFFSDFINSTLFIIQEIRAAMESGQR
jgi:hypothetical protein